MATMTSKLSPSEIVDVLRDEPLVGSTAACRILGIKTSNFGRDARPHLTPITVEGSAPVYFRSDVERLAADRERTDA